ncbi:MAG: biotin--[acetyl-CoA-carboxylase] ligase [Candidatus Brocadiia bacterium]
MPALDPERVFGPEEGARLIGGRGEVVQSVPSAMSVARKRLLDGAPDGYVVIAEHQTAGRGRTGSWHCPPGMGILMSVVLRLGLPSAEQKLLAILGAVAAAQAVQAVGVPARIKWPNDVVVAEHEGGRLKMRKLGGVLVEHVPGDEAAGPYVLGIGLNVNQGSEDLPAVFGTPPTSLRLVKGSEQDRTTVCRALLRELDTWYRRLRMAQPERLLARWRTLSCLLGEPVRLRADGRPLSGTIIGLSSTGDLILRADDGTQMTLSDERAKLLP